MLKCSKEAFAACPDRRFCQETGGPMFFEGSECDKFNRQIMDKPMTNADRIRAMSDEELADNLHQLYLAFSDEGYCDIGKLFCDGKAECIDADGEVHCNEERRKACIMRYLQQPAEVKDNALT